MHIISLNQTISQVHCSEDKIYKIDIDIIDQKDDNDVVIGYMELYTSSINILNMSYHDFFALDSHSQNLSNAFELLFNDDYNFNYEIIPNNIIEELEMIDSIRLLYINEIALDQDYRGKNIFSDVLDIIKMQFNFHLFLLKPFPLQHSKAKGSEKFKLMNLPSNKISLSNGKSKLVQLYSKHNFQLLNVKTKEPYMVMLNYEI